MRYIHKGQEPEFMTDFKRKQTEAELKATYENFRDKRSLNEVLRAEQHHICCYCQQVLDHFQGEPKGGSHNEHLYPECEDPGDGSVDMDYTNIYACCIDSRGAEPRMRHCGDSKENKVIAGLIKNPACSGYFIYNVLGEILPNGEFDKWDDYLINKDHLVGMVRTAFQEICDLNLNCNSLVSERKLLTETLLKSLSQSSPIDVGNLMAAYESSAKFPGYIDMQLYYMRKRL